MHEPGTLQVAMIVEVSEQRPLGITHMLLLYMRRSVEGKAHQARLWRVL